MQIFIDSANFKEIEQWLRQGVIDGVTTNPSIMLKDGVFDIEEGARRGVVDALGLAADGPTQLRRRRVAQQVRVPAVPAALGPAPEALQVKIDHGRRVEREDLAKDQPADDRDAERLAHLGTLARDEIGRAHV